jgi:predicted amidohydrolase YtcJ
VGAGLLIRNAEVADRCVDLRCLDGTIVELSDRAARHPGEHEVDARGGALVPGLHDHHIHLFSLAAHLDSIPCGPPDIESRDALADVLRRAKPNRGWLRGTGYFESVAGPLDRLLLDAIFADQPLRIQHRSGSMWFLNSRAIEELGLDADDAPAGAERDATGRSTGRLFRADDWLRQKLPSSSAPDLSAVSSLLAGYGVTRLTDASPGNGPAEAALFRAAQHSRTLPQRLRLMGGLSLSGVDAGDRLEIGEYKILLDEPALPDLDELVNRIREAHAAQRSVAIHTVTRTEIHFALAAIDAAGARPGDRLEHASLAPLESLERARSLGLAIVTQPNFVAERGDAYRVEVESRDLPCLYRVRSWLEAGIPLAAGTDAPFGDPDPWRAIRAAVTRRTRSGQTLGENEIVSPEAAVQLFSDPILNARTARTPSAQLAVGQPADLCLLNAPWREVRGDLSSERVVMTICSGEIIWSANP